jgi:hypothetical protein
VPVVVLTDATPVAAGVAVEVVESVGVPDVAVVDSVAVPVLSGVLSLRIVPVVEVVAVVVAADEVVTEVAVRTAFVAFVALTVATTVGL